MTVTVRYSCDDCGISDREVTVPARGDEDVIKWSRQTAEYVGVDHHRVSPHCNADKISSLKVPLTATAKVGGPVIQ